MKGDIPPELICTTRSRLESVCKDRCILARQLASIIGIHGAGNWAGVSFHDPQYVCIISDHGIYWSDVLEISPEARHELMFWKASLAEYSFQPIWHVPSAVRVVYSDASDTGYGGYVVEHGQCVSYGQWTRSEAEQSSTWRELAAVLLVLRNWLTTVSVGSQTTKMWLIY